MLKKLLKYDLRSLFKLWWIFAVILFCVCITSGLILSNGISGDFIIVAVITILTLILGMSAFALSPIIMSGIRFYKNLFSDEGYLTFTLPVKKSDIINSKLIASTLLTALSYIVIGLSIFSMMFFPSDNILSQISAVVEGITHFFEDYGIWSIFIVLEGLIALLLASLLSVLFLFVCISFACMITKKARVITAIGIYYGASSVMNFFYNILAFSSANVGTTIFNLPADKSSTAICLLLLVLILILSIVAVALYMLQYFLIDKKLNLA